MRCPCCGEEVGIEHFACESGSKGGMAGRGEKKRRSVEHYRKAGEASGRKRRGLDGSVVEELGKLSKGGE